MSRSPDDIPDLWPAEFEEIDVLPPVTILRAQATRLTQRTRGILEGQVESHSFKNVFYHSLNIVAPALDGYTYQLCSVSHPITLYPADVNKNDRTSVQVNDQDALYQALQRVFASKETSRIVQALLVQSKLGEQPPAEDELPF